MADTATGANPGDTGTPPAKAEDTFTASDMAKLRQSYEHKMSKAAEKAANEAVTSLLADFEAESIDDLRERIESAKATAGQATEAELAAKKSARELEKLRKDLERAQGEVAEFRQRDIKAKSKDAVFKAASAANAYEDDVWAHLRDKVTVGEDGAAVGVDGEPVDDLVKRLVGERKNLLRPVQGAGAGSLPASHGSQAPNLLDPSVRAEALKRLGYG